MKITCKREKLLHAFQTAAMVAPARSPKPILQNIKFDATPLASADNAESKTVVLTATDLEISIAVELSEIEVEQSGSVLLPVDRFGRILRECSDDDIKIEVEGTGTIIRTQRSEFRLPGANVEEFPEITKFAEDKYYEVPARLMREMIRRTLFATDAESSRYALGGVLLEMEDNKITAVGTDGRRLARMDGPCIAVGGNEAGEVSAIVPARAMQMIERALSDDDAEIKVATRENDIIVGSQKVTIQSRLVEGRYPRWRDVFPDRTNAKPIELTVGIFHSAVRQAMITTSEESRGVNFVFSDGLMELTARSAETGQSHVEMPITFSDDEKTTITLDPRFVSDFLKVLDADKTITLDLIDAENAAVFHTDDGYGYVVMPLAKD